MRVHLTKLVALFASGRSWFWPSGLQHLIIIHVGRKQLLSEVRSLRRAPSLYASWTEDWVIQNRGFLDWWGILRWLEKFSGINIADYLLWKLMAGSSIASSVSFTSSARVSKTAKIISMHQYFSKVSILPLEILFPYIWETGTYVFSLANCCLERAVG